MSTISDPSAIKKSNLFICRSSQLLGNILSDIMFAKETAFSEAKILFVDHFKKMKKDAESVTSSGHPRNVANLQIEILNKYIPKLQKITPDSLGIVRSEVTKDIELSLREGVSTKHEARLSVYIPLAKAIDDLTLFGA